MNDQFYSNLFKQDHPKIMLTRDQLRTLVDLVLDLYLEFGLVYEEWFIELSMRLKAVKE